MSAEACKALSRVRGWEWMKGMKILSGWSLDSEGKRVDVMNLSVDDVILRRPFNDKVMQSVRDPVPDILDSRTIEFAVQRLKELWRHDGTRIVETGGGYAVITRSGQLWSPTAAEAILTAFESIPWNEIDNLVRKK